MTLKELSGCYREAAERLIFAATLPFAVSGDSHWGLTASSWFGETIVYEVLTLIFCGIFYLIFRNRSIKQNYAFMNERQKAAYDNNKALRKKLCKKTGPFVAILFLLSIVTLLLPRELFMTLEPTTITSIEEFKELMETPRRVYGSGRDAFIMESIEPDNMPYQTSTGVMVFPETEDSNVVYDHYYREHEIKNADGTTVGTFLWKNDTIDSWSVDWSGENPTFTIIEESLFWHADWLQEFISVLLLGTGLLLVLIQTIRYFSKREHL